MTVKMFNYFSLLPKKKLAPNLCKKLQCQMKPRLKDEALYPDVYFAIKYKIFLLQYSKSQE